jgi:uncharacterized protein YjdB
VDQYGTVTGIAAGRAAITVSTENGGKTASCAVIVETGFVKVESVSLNKDTLDIVHGESETLTYTVYPADAAYTDKVKWTSSNPDVADVDQNGTVTGKAVGSADITVSTENSGKTAKCAVTVYIPVTGVSLDNPEIMVGDNNSTAQLTATVLPDDATNKQVTWTSSNPDVVDVDQNGTVTGKAAGNATITVTTADGSFTDTCTVTVYFVVADASAWISALSSISATGGGTAGSPNVFRIDITGNVSVTGITSGSSITGNYKEVRLTGSGTLSLGSTSNGSIILATANQTFIIDGPTLQGKAGNNTSLVYIEGGSAVKLRSGYIKGNDGLDGGGGVFVYNGNFTMSGGTVSGNTSSMGGGVFVTGSGIFTMTGGNISGNKALVLNFTGAGGGVYVVSGTFTMTGGEISGNEALADSDFPSAGGGVAVESNANFSMTGGVIYGNEAAVSVQLRNNADAGAAAYIVEAQETAIINTTIYSYP